MEMREKQDSTKRLLAYSAAAGLGAFAFGQTAQSAIIHTDIPDESLTQRATGPGYEIYLDIDGDTDTDFVIQFVDFGNVYASIRGRSSDYNLSLTNTAKGNAYYVRSFDLGGLIGFDNPAMAVASGAGEILKPSGDLVANQPGFGRTSPSYMGIALHEQGSPNYYFGWIRIQVDFEPPSVDFAFGRPLGVTVYEFAYETEANTSILAGAVPEPGCLGLLAAGLGAMGLRRRTA